MNRFIKPIRIIAYILTALFLIGAIWWGLSNRQVKINHLQAEINILFNHKLNEPFLKNQIKELKADNVKLKQDVSFYKGKFESDELYIDVLESRYLQVVTYANVAEIILKNNGIEFVRLND